MKLSKHAWTIWGILLVVALVLMVLIPFSRTASWWIAAGCTVLMFLLAAWTFYAAFRKDGLESKILGWPIFKVGAVALAVQVVLGFALMGLAALCPAWVTVGGADFRRDGYLPDGEGCRARGGIAERSAHGGQHRRVEGHPAEGERAVRIGGCGHEAPCGGNSLRRPDAHEHRRGDCGAGGCAGGGGEREKRSKFA